MKRTINFARARMVLSAGAMALTLLTLGGCGPDTSSPAPPSLEWNQQKYGNPPEKRPLSGVEITTDKTWVVAREKVPEGAQPTVAASPPMASVVRYRIGGMDCGDCQHLVANELGKLVGVRQARISQPSAADLTAGKGNPSQSPPEAVVEYDPGRVTSKQIEGTISGLGLWPKPLP